jgi:hypothetical protein
VEAVSSLIDLITQMLAVVMLTTSHMVWEAMLKGCHNSIATHMLISITSNNHMGSSLREEQEVIAMEEHPLDISPTLRESQTIIKVFLIQMSYIELT